MNNWLALIVTLLVCIDTAAQDQLLVTSFDSNIQPLLKQFCFECHSGDQTEAEIDLASYQALADVRSEIKVWLSVREMLNTRQMPPKDARQPNDAERSRLQKWVNDFLTSEAKASAGDPGPVVLRRLNNDEYNYVIRDLTGVDSLDMTGEFPVDGAAGEGFINTGSGQGMSPALVQKYLDAAKQATRHAVLVPSGIRFSQHTTRADQTNEILAQIQAFYRRFTADGGGTAVNLHGIKFNTNQGGVLPVEEYLAVTVAEREALLAGKKSINEIARERSLNARYLATLWTALAGNTTDRKTALIDSLRAKWRTTKPDDLAALTAEIKSLQGALWKYNSIGHIGRQGGPKSWLEPVSSVTMRHELRYKLPDTPGGDVVLYMTASDLGDGNDTVVWQQPRIEFKPAKDQPAHPPILLRDVRALAGRIAQAISSHAARTRDYLAAVAHWQSNKESFADVAKARGLNARLLERWAAVTDTGQRVKREITGLDTRKATRLAGHDEVNGWGVMQTPMMLTNRSDKPIKIGTLTMPARGVTVHPSPDLDSVVAWRCPIDGQFQINGFVADADNVCGNGAAWRVELLSEFGLSGLHHGVIDNGKKQTFGSSDKIAIKKGDIVSLIVGARDRNHVCDTTHISLSLSEVDGTNRMWDLASDVVDNILKSNPRPDSFGNTQVWHFCIAGNKNPEATTTIPPGSALANWRAAIVDKKPDIDKLASEVQQVLTAKSDVGLSDADKQLRRQLLDWKGPLDWVSVVGRIANPSDEKTKEDGRIGNPSYGLAPTSFTGTDLQTKAPQAIEVRLPAALVAGGEFVTTGVLHPESAENGSVQLQVRSDKPATLSVSTGAPILVGPASRPRVEAELKQLAELFPPALCYARIVPVDEVVTLTLFHREDDHLKRLMLDDAHVAQLDQLWDELHYVSREPLKLVVAYEQIVQFATQDRPDLVKAFAPMEKPINDRADKFRIRLVATEPAHVEALLSLANRAWRRPLSVAEQQNLRGLYQSLRDAEIPHEDAIRLTLARVLTSPAFLYKLEIPAAGKDAASVTGQELATRLSFFLWSSIPDEQLRRVAYDGQLAHDKMLLAQTRRMLQDPHTRRLAIQFACQWLHMRDFDKNDDKNEKLYPEFVTLRHDMYEETVRFFEDMFRNNGSILDMLAADHTFLNASLARHYGIEPNGNEWQRVEGIKSKGRGGILGMASLLASQSGASRTSPILRGNWVYETLLGERLPRPPANVPQIPDEIPSGLTTRQLIEKHTSVAACAKCHLRVDPYGFALEQFDAIGRLRPNKVDTKTTLATGQTIDGISGLRDYLLNERRHDFVRHFCRKLLGFSLGRELQLSDEPLVDTMMKRLERDDYRFHVAVEAIVLSDQFTRIRGSVSK